MGGFGFLEFLHFLMGEIRPNLHMQILATIFILSMLPEVSCHHNCSFEIFQSANHDVERHGIHHIECSTTSGIYTIVVDDGFVRNGTELPGLESLR
jgi:hypothetical protein